MTLLSEGDTSEYRADLDIDHDDESELGRRFRYLSRSGHEFRLPNYFPGSMYNLLHGAAYLGDLEFLECLNEEHGGALYDQQAMINALACRHYDFFIKYVELCKGYFSHDESYCTNDRYEPVVDVMFEDIPEEDCIHLVRYFYDEMIPSLPAYDQARQAGNDTIVDFGLTQFNLLLGTIQDDKQRADCRRFLVEERGLRFEADHVKHASRYCCRHLYTYVLDHLRSDLDRETIRNRYPLQEIADKNLLEQMCDVCKAL